MHYAKKKMMIFFFSELEFKLNTLFYALQMGTIPSNANIVFTAYHYETLFKNKISKLLQNSSPDS